jgi:pyridoxal phosphate enzyme (YggS family)
MGLDENAWQAAMRRIARAAEAAGRDPGLVRLCAVSKTRTADEVRAARGLGQTRFGENYVQEAAAKRDELADLADLEWRLIGPLQGNKAVHAAGVFDAVESIDRAKIAERLSSARPAGRRPMEALVQVNISGETSKSGVEPGEALPLARLVASLPGLAFAGFMGIAEPTPDLATQRVQFARLRRCRDEARDAGLDAHVLSMGMTADLEAAILEGSTQVRLGTALFGERPPRPGR